MTKKAKQEVLSAFEFLFNFKKQSMQTHFKSAQEQEEEKEGQGCHYLAWCIDKNDKELQGMADLMYQADIITLEERMKLSHRIDRLTEAHRKTYLYEL